MTEGRCRVCDQPIPERHGARGRSPIYCSAACRQRAYRSRQEPIGDESVRRLIDDIQQRARNLAPQVPTTFYTDVSDLSSSIGRLRRMAKVALDASADTDDAESAEDTEHHAPEPAPSNDVTAREHDIVTDDSVTKTAGEDPAVTTAMRSGDEWTFTGLVEPFRQEIQIHCYRMAGSYDDSEDLMQETFLRAWRRRETFEGRSTLRAWLYKIATNVCLDFLRRNARTPQPYDPVPGIDSGSATPPSRVAWLQPCPEQLLTGQTPDDDAPENSVISRETIELVFIAAIQHLPAQQRAVLLTRDALGWSAADTAAQLDISVAAVNSTLQRARAAVRRHLPERRTDWSVASTPTAEEREVLQRYMAAAERADFDAVSELLSEDVVLTMPPNPHWFVGRKAMLNFILPTVDADSPQYFGEFRHLPAQANRQPAAAGYVRRPGTTVYRAQVLDVLRVENGRIAEITAFEPHLFPAFGLPLTL